MPHVSNPEQVFEQALEAFPYDDLASTGIAQGDLREESTYIEYAEEYQFVVGNLFDEKLTAGGWIEYRQEDDDVYITAFFGIARNYEWKEKSILGEYEALHGWYDIESQEWEFEIGKY